VSVGTNAQPIATAGLTALLAASGHPVADSDVGLSFWIGTVLVVTGVVLAQRRRDPRRTDAPAPPQWEGSRQ
jgi:hypothetical protein